MVLSDTVRKTFFSNMLVVLVRKYKAMLLCSIFFFYLGCGVTLSFMRLECADAVAVATDESSTGSGVEYAVLILSGPDNESRRNTIRTTWGKLAGNIFIENGEKLYKWNHTWVKDGVKNDFIKFYFAIGTKGLSIEKLAKLKSEHNLNNDLLLLNFKDSYESLSTKVVLSMVWFDSNLKALKYVVKCDDDSFVRIDLIVRDLEYHAPEYTSRELRDYVTFKNHLPSYKGLYWGYFDGRAKARLSGKWKEKDWFLCNTYLPYALGGGYVISSSIVSYIAKNMDMLSMYNSEDVSMGVWTAALDGINRVHDIRFDTEWTSRGCEKHMLVRHKQTPSDMFQMYTTLVHFHGERLCKTEAIERKSYHYMWDVLPSMCCK